MFPNLKAEMARKNLTPPVVAQMIGISTSSMTKRMNGSYEFKLKEIDEIMKLFPGCSVEYLFKR